MLPSPSDSGRFHAGDAQTPTGWHTLSLDLTSFPVSRYKEIQSHWIAVGAIISMSIVVVAAVIKAKSVIMLIKKERKGIDVSAHTHAHAHAQTRTNTHKHMH